MKDEAIAKAVEAMCDVAFGGQWRYVAPSIQDNIRAEKTRQFFAALRAIAPEWKLTCREATEDMREVWLSCREWSADDEWRAMHDAAEGVGNDY